MQLPQQEYITLLHLFLLDSGWNPHSNWNFRNSRVFHLHIFFLIICNSNQTGVEIYPQNPHRLTSAFSSWINWNLHSWLLLPCECCHHCTVTRDCQLTTTIHDDTACPPNHSHHSLPPLTSVNGDWHCSHTLPSRTNGNVCGCKHAMSRVFFGCRQLSTQCKLSILFVLCFFFKY